MRLQINQQRRHRRRHIGSASSSPIGGDEGNKCPAVQNRTTANE
jgi:hypothetical protein